MTDKSQNCTVPIPQRVQSERVSIRPTTRADAPYLRQWWNDPAVMGPSGNGDGMHFDDADMEQWFQRTVDGHDEARHFMLCRRGAEEEPFGEFYVACDDRPGCITFSLVIGDTTAWEEDLPCQALLAYAAAMFEADCCGMLRLDVPVMNERTLATCERLGFVVERVWANGRCKTMILTRDAHELRQTEATAEAYS